MIKMNNLENRIAIVTGGTKGIGKGICLELANRGATVYAFGRSTPKSFSEYSDNAILESKIKFIQCDVANLDNVNEAVTKVKNEAGKIDILVNNAGITKDKLLMRMSETDWDTVMDINLKGVFNTCKSISRIMMSQRQGRIINIGSIVGTTGNAGQSNYSASKAGLIGFTKSLAKELGSRGILVNLLAPGYVKTDMTEKLNEEQLESFVNNIPLKRGGIPNDIAKVVAFFASDDASYITGQILHVDGGLAI